MKYNIGDKFELEIKDTYMNSDGRRLFQMDNFNALVFDEYGLDKLHRISDNSGPDSAELLWSMIKSESEKGRLLDLVASSSDVDEFVANCFVEPKREVNVGDVVNISNAQGVVLHATEREIHVMIKLTQEAVPQSEDVPIVKDLEEILNECE